MNAPIRFCHSSVTPENQLSFSQDHVMAQIERAGRTCWKSEEKIGPGSAEKLITHTLLRFDHESTLEAGWVAVEGPLEILRAFQHSSPYLNMTFQGKAIVSGNVRAFRDLFASLWVSGLHAIQPYTGIMAFFRWNWPVLFGDVVPPSEYHGYNELSISDPVNWTPHETLAHMRLSYRWICDRGVSHELVRHRIASFSQESTRYVNYGKKGMLFIIPTWVPETAAKQLELHGKTDTLDQKTQIWIQDCKRVSQSYLSMLSAGAKPQEARQVLSNSVKTEILFSIDLSDIIRNSVVLPNGKIKKLGFLNLRAAEAAHPDIRVLAEKIESDIQQYIH